MHALNKWITSLKQNINFKKSIMKLQTPSVLFIISYLVPLIIFIIKVNQNSYFI